MLDHVAHVAGPEILSSQMCIHCGKVFSVPPTYREGKIVVEARYQHATIWYGVEDEVAFLATGIPLCHMLD